MHLYIDPGTGSMLFTILIGVLSAGIYAFRKSIMKLRFLLTSGIQKQDQHDKIPYVIFSDSKRYWNVFEPICEEFESRKIDLVYLTASPDDPAFSKDYSYIRREFIGAGNKAFARLNILRADILLSTTPGLDVYQWKRSRDVSFYIHVPHSPADMTLYHMFGLDFYDAVLCSGEYEIQQLRELENLRSLPAKDIQIAGLTYFDALAARLQNCKEISHAGSKETVILLAPSWGKSSILQKFGTEIIDKLLETGYHLIIRPHPQSFTAEKELMDSLMRRYPENGQLEWNRDNDNFDVLLRSDLMISDFSGVIFDFALVFDKPVIYLDTEFDSAPYDACWLEAQPWTFETLPKIGMKLTSKTLVDLKTAIDSCLCSKQYEAARSVARDETWQNRGRSASSICDYMLQRCETLLQSKSNNIQ